MVFKVNGFTAVPAVILLCLLSCCHCKREKECTLEQLLDKTQMALNDALTELRQEDELPIPTIVFHARDIKDTTVNQNEKHIFTNVNQNEKYIFTNVIYNYGDGYDGTTGMFTAPVSGTYMFTLNLCVSGDNYVCYEIVVSDESLARGVEYGGGGGHPCNAMDAIVVLEAGQEVWVKSTYSSVAYTDYYRWNSFAGALLH